MSDLKSNKRQKHIIVIIFCLIIFCVGYFVVYSFFVSGEAIEYVANNIKSDDQKTVEEKKVLHIETPDPLKSIYMTQCVVGTKPFRESLVKIVEDTEINSIIIDIKDYTGKISFDTTNPKVVDSISDKCGASDMKEFIEYLHSKNIYVMGRLS